MEQPGSNYTAASSSPASGGYTPAQMRLLRSLTRFSTYRNSGDLLQQVANELQEIFAAHSAMALVRRATANHDELNGSPPRITFREAGTISEPFRYRVGAYFRTSQRPSNGSQPAYYWQAEPLAGKGQPPGTLYSTTIYVANEATGVASFLLESGRTLDPLDLQLLELYSEGLSTAVSALQLFSYTERRLEELKLLYEVAAIMAGASLDLTMLLRQTIILASRVLRASAATLMLLDAKTNELVFEIPTGERGDALTQYRQKVGEGISGWVAATGEPLLINRVAEDPRWSASADHASGFVTKSALCTPLTVMGRTIGVLEVLNKLDEDGREGLFTAEDLALLNTIGTQAAVAIENAQLYQSLVEERDRIIQTEEEVRRQLNRDLHDGPAQGLAGIIMRLDYIKKLMVNDPRSVMLEIDSLQELARRTNKDIRNMLSQLRPIILETQGLIPALQSYFASLSESGISYHFLADQNAATADLGSTAEGAIYIIIQEGINNIKKHTEARNVWLTVKQAPIPVGPRSSKTNSVTSPLYGTNVLVTPGLVFTLRDDGAGFNVEEVLNSYSERGSYGLLNMRERAQLLGGNVRFDSRPGSGTTVTIQVPLSTTTRDDVRPPR